MKSKKYNIDKKKLFVILVLLFVVAYIAFTVFLREGFSIDEFSFKGDYVSTFKIITKFGNWYTILAILIASFLLKNKNYFKYIFINLVSIVLLNQCLKFIFQRARPELNLINETGYSFPSGHAMVSMGFYGFIIYLLLTSKISKKYKIISTVILESLIIMIGFSRIYLGVHYFTDVIVGFIISIIYLIIYIDIVKIGDTDEKKS